MCGTSEYGLLHFTKRPALGGHVTLGPLADTVTILVVDDDALITMNTVDLISDLGYTAVEAYSAAQALDILNSRAGITLMMTDYSMPGMTGPELALAARAIRPDLPILLVTGYAELPNNQESHLPRLEKPYRIEELTAKIQQLLKGL
jgi:CheY-like chemotaxis protein